MLFFALAARLLLETILLVVFAVWSFRLADDFAFRLLGGLAAPGAAALVWGLFISPDRRFELGRVPRLVLELTLFWVAAGALWQMGWRVAAMLLVVAECVDRFGLIWLRRRELANRYNEYRSF
jgi:hypothetical protein